MALGLNISAEVYFFHQPEVVTPANWQEVDHGPGYVSLPEDGWLALRARRMDDDDLAVLVEEVAGLGNLLRVDLSENRKITNAGLEYLQRLKQLRELNLSSCGITDAGMDTLTRMDHLVWLNLSYCNRLTDLGVKKLSRLKHLTFLDVQGIPKINNTSLSKIRRPNLVIHL